MSKRSLQKIVLFNKKVTLIYNPYLEKIFKIKKIKKNKLNNFNILSIGRLTKQKNFPLLINAVIKLSKKYNKINLLISLSFCVPLYCNFFIKLFYLFIIKLGFIYKLYRNKLN